MKKRLTFIFLIITIPVILILVRSKTRIFKVATSSMEPEIKKGSMIITAGKQKYEVGDVASYREGRNSAVVTHRIIKILKNEDIYFFIFKGDNNENQDPHPISEKEIIGKVVCVIPYIGDLFYIIFERKFILYPISITSGFFLGRNFRKQFEKFM